MNKKPVFFLLLGFLLFSAFTPSEAQQKVDISGATVSSDLGKSTTYFNPLGFLQFGPIVGKEFLVGPSVYTDIHFRYSALGVLYQLVESDAFLNTVSMGSAAIGSGARYFLPNSISNNHFYVGGITEIGWGGTRGDLNTTYEWKGVDLYLDFMGNFGYRWRYPSGFFLNVGLYAGFAPTIKNTWWYISDPSITYESHHDVLVIAMLELSLGWEKK